MSYEPPCTEVGKELIPGQEDVIAPGVLGYAIQQGETIFIPLIIAENEGSGDVGRFLDSLSGRCVVPCVTSPRLAAMLIRRGFSPEFDGGVDIWKRKR
jgi:hypothetical protein